LNQSELLCCKYEDYLSNNFNRLEELNNQREEEESSDGFTVVKKTNRKNNNNYNLRNS